MPMFPPRPARRLALALTATAATSLALSGTAIADSQFVIGDGSTALGAQVTFWGAQWWKDNPLSTGLAPAAFKGYADTVTGSCGGSWSTAPGNSSKPPASLAGTIPVIVSDQIAKTGPVISGDIREVVLVAVDPGYAGDPGHPGTGTIVGYACGGPATGTGDGGNGGGSTTGSGGGSTGSGSGSGDGGSTGTGSGDGGGVIAF